MFYGEAPIEGLGRRGGDRDRDRDRDGDRDRRDDRGGGDTEEDREKKRQERAERKAAEREAHRLEREARRATQPGDKKNGWDVLPGATGPIDPAVNVAMLTGVDQAKAQQLWKATGAP